jgi:hypothetical protein
MASRGERHALMILGLSEGIAKFIEASYINEKRNKTILEYVEQIKKRCSHAHDLWKAEATRKDIKRIDKSLHIIEDIIAENKKASISVLTSLPLALLSDLSDELNKKEQTRTGEKSKKAEGLVPLITQYRRLHRHFDRKLDKWEDYDLAVKAVNAITKRRRMGL